MDEMVLIFFRKINMENCISESDYGVHFYRFVSLTSLGFVTSWLCVCLVLIKNFPVVTVFLIYFVRVKDLLPYEGCLIHNIRCSGTN